MSMQSGQSRIFPDSRCRGLWTKLLLLAWVSVAMAGLDAQQASSSTSEPQQSTPSAPAANPVLRNRPAGRPDAHTGAIAAPGKIHLDVVVDDDEGNPVPGLEPGDFKLFDDDRPAKILSFRSFDGDTVKPDPLVQVFLLIDTLNLPFEQVAFTREQIANFLRQNGGHLATPTSLLLLNDAGLSVQPRPSTDGNALLSILSGIKGGIHTLNSGMGVEGDVERFQRSLRQMSAIAENEAHQPGRKLVIWVGPGWPMLDSNSFTFSAKEQRRYFAEIVALSTLIRQARITLDSVSAPEPGFGEGSTRRFLYQDYLKGVPSAKKADTGNLALKVLVTQSGGRILGPDNNLASQINQCITHADAFYSISFNPPIAEREDEYHNLKVQLPGRGLVARTSTGYYNQPVKAD